MSINTTSYEYCCTILYYYRVESPDAVGNDVNYLLFSDRKKSVSTTRLPRVSSKANYRQS